MSEKPVKFPPRAAKPRPIKSAVDEAFRRFPRILAELAK